MWGKLLKSQVNYSFILFLVNSKDDLPTALAANLATITIFSLNRWRVILSLGTGRYVKMMDYPI